MRCFSCMLNRHADKIAIRIKTIIPRLAQLLSVFPIIRVAMKMHHSNDMNPFIFF